MSPPCLHGPEPVGNPGREVPKSGTPKGVFWARPPWCLLYRGPGRGGPPSIPANVFRFQSGGLAGVKGESDQGKWCGGEAKF